MQSIIADETELLMTTTGECVYLYHLAEPISNEHTSQHYLGWAPKLAGRDYHHKQGRGARFTQVAVERGIEFKLVRVWPGADRNFERELKDQKNLAMLCPHCAAERKAKRAAQAKEREANRKALAPVVSFVIAFALQYC